MKIRDFSKVELLVFILTLVLVFSMAARAPVDSDTWWHLRAGEQTWRDGVPLRVDVFSHTRYGEKWVNHSWLAQVGLFLLYRWQGFLGLSGVVALLAALSMGIVYLRMEGPALWKAALLVLGSLVAAVIWAPRPQMCSFFLLALTLYILEGWRQGEKSSLWGFLLLFVVWSNLHAGYTLGLMAIGLTWIGSALDHFIDPESSENMPWERIFCLGGWGLAAGVAVLVNPNGLDTWRVPFQTVGMNALQQFVVEWASPDFHQAAQQPFLWLLFAVMASWAFSRKKVAGADALLIIGYAYLALVARRNFGPFALAAMPTLSRHGLQALQPAIARLKQLAAGNERWGKLLKAAHPDPQSSQPLLKRVINLTLVGLLALGAGGKLAVVSHPALMAQYLSEQYPAAAVSAIEAAHQPGNLLNEYNWGGYLLWRLPEHPVFVDGRTDLYGDEIIGEWIALINGETGWRESLQEKGVRWVILQPDRPLLDRLAAEPGWELDFEDHNAVVYRRLPK